MKKFKEKIQVMQGSRLGNGQHKKYDFVLNIQGSFSQTDKNIDMEYGHVKDFKFDGTIYTPVRTWKSTRFSR